ncbi:MAG: TfoX/Sxy family protein [Pseudomonadota bacterium]
MADEELTEYALELFSSLPEVTPRRMFGGVGFFSQGLMFGLIAEGEIYLKCPDEEAHRFEEEGSHAFIYEGQKKGTIKIPYRTIPERLHDDRDELAEWVARTWHIAFEKDQKKSPSQRKYKPLF